MQPKQSDRSCNGWSWVTSPCLPGVGFLRGKIYLLHMLSLCSCVYSALKSFAVTLMTSLDAESKKKETEMQDLGFLRTGLMIELMRNKGQQVAARSCVPNREQSRRMQEAGKWQEKQKLPKISFLHWNKSFEFTLKSRTLQLTLHFVSLLIFSEPSGHQNIFNFLFRT